MTTLYKKGSTHHARFGGVEYDFDIAQSKDEAQLKRLRDDGWVDSLPETIAEKPKPKPKAKSKKAS